MLYPDRLDRDRRGGRLQAITLLSALEIQLSVVLPLPAALYNLSANNSVILGVILKLSLYAENEICL